MVISIGDSPFKWINLLADVVHHLVSIAIVLDIHTFHGSGPDLVMKFLHVHHFGFQACDNNDLFDERPSGFLEGNANSRLEPSFCQQRIGPGDRKVLIITSAPIKGCLQIGDVCGAVIRPWFLAPADSAVYPLLSNCRCKLPQAGLCVARKSAAPPRVSSLQLVSH